MECSALICGFIAWYHFSLPRPWRNKPSPLWCLNMSVHSLCLYRWHIWLNWHRMLKYVPLHGFSRYCKTNPFSPKVRRIMIWGALLRPSHSTVKVTNLSESMWGRGVLGGRVGGSEGGGGWGQLEGLIRPDHRRSPPPISSPVPTLFP